MNLKTKKIGRYVIKCTSIDGVYLGKDALGKINLVSGLSNAYHFDYIYSLMLLHNIHKKKPEWQRESFKVTLVGYKEV